jgi:multidrug efflux pump
VFYVGLRKLAGNRPLKLHGEVPHGEAFAHADFGGGANARPHPAAPMKDNA